MTLNHTIFVRPHAHRGLHDPEGNGPIENTGPAFEAAIAKGYGIECDVQPGRDGFPIVFHDTTTGRLMSSDVVVRDLSADDLANLKYKKHNTPLLSLSDTLALVAGRVPLMIEVKSDWKTPDPDFMGSIATLLTNYPGPVTVKSFDPGIMLALKALAPTIPRGLVAMDFENSETCQKKFGAARCTSLTHLLEAGPIELSFLSYHVHALPMPMTRFSREAQKLPLFTWTVRTDQDWQKAQRWADAAIFEGDVPEPIRKQYQDRMP